ISKLCPCVPGATIVPSLAALPFLSLLSQSERASDRTSFVRVFSDYAAFARDRRRAVPEDWLQALRRCLDISRPEERSEHLAVLAPFETLIEERHVAVAARPISASREIPFGQLNDTHAPTRTTAR